MQLNKATVDLIKSFEGWEPVAYKDAVGVWTIGYGHTSAAGAPKVVAGLSISKAEGEEILRRDMAKYAKAISEQVKVPLNPNQFGALVSWCYNVGPGATAKSTLVRKLNAGQYEAVPGELMKWTKAKGKTLKGLVRRRAAEGVLFRTSYIAPAAPPEAAKPIPAPNTVPMEETRPEAPVAGKGIVAGIAALVVIAIGWIGDAPCNLFGVFCQ